MASVLLDTVWLSTASDFSDARAFPYLSALQVDTSKRVEVRPYANGRLRTVTRPGLARSFSLKLTACTREDVDWLEDRIGLLMLARDDRGRAIFGVYATVPVEEHQYDQEAEVTIDFAEVTATEAV